MTTTTHYPRTTLLLSFLIFCILSLAESQAQDTRLKISIVDMQKLFKEYHRTSEEQRKFSEEFARIQKENNERMRKIRSLEEVMATQRKKIEDPVIADRVRRKEAKEFQLKLEEARAMDRERREYLGRRTRALELKKQASMQGILEEIRKHIIEHSRKEDLDYVFDKSGPFLLHAKDATDITAALLKELNKNAPGMSKSTGTIAPQTSNP